MERWNRLTIAGVRALAGATLTLALLGVPTAAAAQDASQEVDPLKFTSNGPVMLINYVLADKAAVFEEAWRTLRAEIAKSDNTELRKDGETLGNLYRVDQPPFDTQHGKTTIYVMRLDAPSTMFSYNASRVIFEELWKNGKEGAALTYEQAMAMFEKFKDSNPPVVQIWKLARAN
jgi:hypothetical protein